MIARCNRTLSRVLVVDDEPNISDLVSTALRYEGFDVTSAGTARGALDLVAAFRPHLVVLDVMLPDLDGFEVSAPPAPGSKCVPDPVSHPPPRARDRRQGPWSHAPAATTT